MKRFIWKPRTNHGGLKGAWDSGALSIGAKVKLILVRKGKSGQVNGAAVQPGYWLVLDFFERDGRKLAWIEPAASVVGDRSWSGAIEVPCSAVATETPSAARPSATAAIFAAG